MLRIISGKYRGRTIVTSSKLSPTMAATREAIFSIITSRQTIFNSFVLDLFCGSGSLSFEALSRGAKHVFMVDSDYHNLQLPKKTSENLNIDSDVTLICCSADKLPAPLAKCDIVFIDPPYNKNLVTPTLNGLANSGWIHSSTLVILETRKDEILQNNAHFEVMLERTYGISKIIFLRHIV